MNPATTAKLFARLDRELWLITSASAVRQSGGLIATFVSQASIVPELPRLLIGLAKQHHTCQLIEASSVFVAHLLGEQHLDWVYRFGLQTGRNADKLAGLTLRPGVGGVPVLTDALGWLECRVEARLDSGDRTLFLAEVVDGTLTDQEPLLTMQRFLQLAPADKLQQLKAALVRDAAVDAAAITAWRNPPQPPP